MLFIAKKPQETRPLLVCVSSDTQTIVVSGILYYYSYYYYSVFLHFFLHATPPWVLAQSLPNFSML